MLPARPLIMSFPRLLGPRVFFGQTNMITRQIDAKTEQFCYGFDGTQPLELELVVELIEQQCQTC